MSDEQEEELAMQRELEDAFATTRPRAGFEDELWLRMQAQRPAPNKIRDVFTGFWEGIRAVPMVPAAATAAVVVVAIGVGLLAYTGALQPRGAASTASSQWSSGSGLALKDGTFGRLPTPSFNPVVRSSAPAAPTSPNDTHYLPSPYYGPATLTWAGQLNVTLPSAPVFRYREPSAKMADAFAAGLGAGLDDRASGLGTYSARDYKLIVRGTMQSPPTSPVYLIVPTPLMPPVSAAGASPVDVATVFLAEHSLAPQWPYTAVVQVAGDLTRVIFIRQFDAPGYPSPARLIDSNGEPYGLEVDLKGNAVQGVAGLLPLNLDTTNYPIISGDRAIQAALMPKQPAPSSPGPAVQLTKAELVYVLAPAGPQSFYEPAYLFSGTFQMGGATYEMRVLVPAVDPSQRS
jgi:hypothetical protein